MKRYLLVNEDRTFMVEIWTPDDLDVDRVLTADTMSFNYAVRSVSGAVWGPPKKLTLERG